MADHNAHTYFGSAGPGAAPRRPAGDLHRRHAGLSPGPVWAGPAHLLPSDQAHFRPSAQALADGIPPRPGQGHPGGGTPPPAALPEAMSSTSFWTTRCTRGSTVGWRRAPPTSRVEIALDLLLLQEQHRATSPKVRTEGKGRTAAAAAEMLGPLGARPVPQRPVGGCPP